MTSKVKESVDEKTDHDEAFRREPTSFMKQENPQNVFMVTVI